jgi:hypothetical protein
VLVYCELGERLVERRERKREKIADKRNSLRRRGERRSGGKKKEGKQEILSNL